jgi:hypothetical protein
MPGTDPELPHVLIGPDRRPTSSPTRGAIPLQTQVDTLVRLAAARNAVTVSLGGGRDPESRAALDAFEGAWTTRGGYVLTRVDWPARAASWNRQARRLTDWAPDLWVIADTPAGWAPAVQRLATTDGWTADRTLGFAGLDHIDTIHLAGADILDGMTGATVTGGRWWIRGNKLHHSHHPTLLTAP